MSKYEQKWEEARCFFTFSPLHSITKIQIKDKTMASSSLPTVTASGHILPSGNTNNNGSYLPFVQVSRAPLSSRGLYLFPSRRASPTCQSWGNRSWKSPTEWGCRATSFRSLMAKKTCPLSCQQQGTILWYRSKGLSHDLHTCKNHHVMKYNCLCTDKKKTKQQNLEKG